MDTERRYGQAGYACIDDTVDGTSPALRCLSKLSFHPAMSIYDWARIQSSERSELTFRDALLCVTSMVCAVSLDTVLVT